MSDRDNTNKFTGKAAEYVQYRERYDPQILLPLLKDWCGLTPEWTIADIGAGTGMLSDVFLANGNPVLALEPNSEMLAACEQLHQNVAKLQTISASAEATGLPDASVDMIAVGRALHWFDLLAAIREFRRILKPEGWVVIVAFGRDQQGRQENLALKQYLYEHTHEAKETRAAHNIYAALEACFQGGVFHHVEISGEMQLNWEGLRGLTLSLSYAPEPGSEGFSNFEKGLRDYFEQYAQEGVLTLTTRYWINVGQFGKDELTRSTLAS